MMNMDISVTPNYSYIFDFENDFIHQRTRKWMVENWTWVFYYCGIYMLVIFGGQHFMQNRPRFELRGPLIIWNAMLSMFSIMGAFRTAPELIHVLRHYGLFHSVCVPSYIEQDRVCGFWTWLFVLSKLPELGDTIFIVLPQSQLINSVFGIATIKFIFRSYLFLVYVKNMGDCKGENAEISEEPPLEVEGEPQQVNNCEKATAALPDIIPGVQVANIEEVIQADPDCYELDLNHHRIERLEKFELLTQVERLYLRWNLIKKIENLHMLTSLVELEMYDNQITRLENLDSLVNLQILDVSFNRLTKIENLQNLFKLEKLYLVANRITQIENINMLTNLTMLELGDNKIKKLENIDSLVNLRQLFLGRNKITKIENLDRLINLELLSLQANRIMKIENLENLTKLTELYLSENGIERIENLDNNIQLETLDLAKNRLKSIDNINNLTQLEELWLNNNCIDNWRNVEVIKENKALKTIYLEHNPVADEATYRLKLKDIAPWLEKIDATLCR